MWGQTPLLCSTGSEDNTALWQRTTLSKTAKMFSLSSILKHKDTNNLYFYWIISIHTVSLFKNLKFWFSNGQNFSYGKLWLLRKNCCPDFSKIANMFQPRGSTRPGDVQIVQKRWVYNWVSHQKIPHGTQDHWMERRDRGSLGNLKFFPLLPTCLSHRRPHGLWCAH